MMTFLLWLLLLVFCWPLALLAIVLYPFVWLLTLPFRLLGIAVNGVYPNQKEFAHWRRIGLAERSFMVDRTTLPRLCAVIEEHGQRVDEVPLPIGLYHTERFYGLIASRMGVDDERVAACLRPLIEEHAPAHRALRERVRGRRLALCIRMHKSHQSDLLAYEGLTSLELLRGAGFDVHILVQGPPEERARRSFAGRLAELGSVQVSRSTDGPARQLWWRGYSHKVSSHFLGR